MDDADMLIRVHESWSGWHSAEIRLSDLDDVHWRQPPGAPHRMVHAFVACARLSTGGLPHICDRRTMPHRVLVCVLKRHTPGTIYGELVSRAEAAAAIGRASAPVSTDPLGSLRLRG